MFLSGQSTLKISMPTIKINKKRGASTREKFLMFGVLFPFNK